MKKKNPELAKKLEESSKDLNDCLDKKREGTKCEIIKDKIKCYDGIEEIEEKKVRDILNTLVDKLYDQKDAVCADEKKAD